MKKANVAVSFKPYVINPIIFFVCLENKYVTYNIISNTNGKVNGDFNGSKIIFFK